MERPIDYHQWAAKTEIRHLLSRRPDLKMQADIRTANDNRSKVSAENVKPDVSGFDERTRIMPEFTEGVVCKGQDLTVAFISGTKEQQEEQELEIRKYCDVGGTLLSPDNPILSDWHEIENNLKCGDTLIITDLKTISGDRREFAGRIFALIKDKIKLLPLKEHYEWSIWNRCLSGSSLAAERILLRLEKLFDRIHERTDIPIISYTSPVKRNISTSSCVLR